MSNTGAGEKPIWGAKAIAEEINAPLRRTYHLIASGSLPVKKIGGRLCAFPTALRAALRADEVKAS